MLSSRSTSSDLRGLPPQKVAPPSAPTLSAASAIAGGFVKPNSSIIGQDLTIIGNNLKIISQGVLQIDGELRGDLHGSEIVIGENGKVLGSVTAKSVIIRGAVNGDVRGLTVSLQATAQVEGDIHHQALIIEEGAAFEGGVRRPRDAAELMPILDPAQLASSA